MTNKMKQKDFKKCVLCNKGMMNGGAIHFYRIRLENFIINIDAVRRQAGMEMMMGSPTIAQAMGPDEDMATSMGEQEMLICANCFLNSDVRLFSLLNAVEQEAT